MLTAQIYGYDGYDKDVTRNIFEMYRRLGITPIVSKEFLPVEILCVLRTPYHEVMLPPFEQIHVFDYVCNENSRFFQSLEDLDNVIVFFPTESRRRFQLEKVPKLENKSIVSFPPVIPQLWTMRKQQGPFEEIVHIGNYKKLMNQNDYYLQKFMSLLREGRIDVWGEGWQNRLDYPMWHGKAKTLETAMIYSRFNASIGIQYPEQRGMTVSGRFWQAPLNGNLVFVEPSSLARKIPGLVETDYSDFWVDYERIRRKIDRAEVSNDAHIFWYKKYLELNDFLKTQVVNINARKRIYPRRHMSLVMKKYIETQMRRLSLKLQIQ